jgi:CRISPR-associated endoribonuclease Cas6
MEHIATDYAEKLHSQSLNPYSQYFNPRRDGAFWVIQTMTQTAGEEIIEPLASPEFSDFRIERLNADVSILEKNQIDIPMEDMVSRYYFEQGERILRIKFLTPTAFKSGGEYVFYPDIRLIFGSLMRKHGTICEGVTEEETETLDAITKNAKIISYSLKSVYSELGRVRLPAFCGSITIKASGASSLVNYMSFLLRFGEYSGVGIKCSMGMGGMKVLDRADNRKRSD